MKKVLALVLAVIMVCTMAMAVYLHRGACSFHKRRPGWN